MRGEILSMHLFDVGGTLDLGALGRAFAGRDPKRGPPIGKGTPAYVEFPQPLVVTQPPVEIDTPVGRLPADVVLAFFPLGVVSVRLRLRIDVARFSDLWSWNQSLVHIGAERLLLEPAARQIVERERAAWEACVRERYTHKILFESYTVFAFQDVREQGGDLLAAHSRDVSGLLKGEDGSRLHEKEVKEATKKWFSYYTDDLIVLDWDAALLVDPDADYEDLLFVLEIANLQLLEFRAYDDYLDDLIERSYDELGRMFRRPSLIRNVRGTVHELSLIRMEVAELADEADNITKFLGDWFLARVYQAAQEKFHIPAWRASVDDKLATVNKLYQLANDEADSLRLITLELLIVLLFLLDLVLVWYSIFK
jgi:hypothetical protein